MESVEPIQEYASFTFTGEDGKEIKRTYEIDEKGYVSFGDVSGFLGQQSQYVCRYVDGMMEEYPKLGEGLRIEGTSDEYHFMRIHKDDVLEFVSRYKDYRGMK